ncbi:MAG: peptidase, partial [Maritimibacter sp.]
MSAGEITPNPILSRHGWHIIRMDAVADGEVLPFDAVRGEISAALEKSAWVSAMRGFVEGLVAGAEISGIDLSQPELQHAG